MISVEAASRSHLTGKISIDGGVMSPGRTCRRKAKLQNKADWDNSSDFTGITPAMSMSPQCRPPRRAHGDPQRFEWLSRNIPA
jgi:hypothetical protein